MFTCSFYSLWIVAGRTVQGPALHNPPGNSWAWLQSCWESQEQTQVTVSRRCPGWVQKTLKQFPLFTVWLLQKQARSLDGVSTVAKEQRPGMSRRGEGTSQAWEGGKGTEEQRTRGCELYLQWNLWEFCHESRAELFFQVWAALSDKQNSHEELRTGAASFQDEPRSCKSWVPEFVCSSHASLPASPEGGFSFPLVSAVVLPPLPWFLLFFLPFSIWSRTALQSKAHGSQRMSLPCLWTFESEQGGHSS